MIISKIHLTNFIADQREVELAQFALITAPLAPELIRLIAFLTQLETNSLEDSLNLSGGASQLIPDLAASSRIQITFNCKQDGYTRKQPVQLDLVEFTYSLEFAPFARRSGHQVRHEEMELIYLDLHQRQSREVIIKSNYVIISKLVHPEGEVEALYSDAYNTGVNHLLYQTKARFLPIDIASFPLALCYAFSASTLHQDAGPRVSYLRPNGDNMGSALGFALSHQEHQVPLEQVFTKIFPDISQVMVKMEEATPLFRLIQPGKRRPPRPAPGLLTRELEAFALLLAALTTPGGSPVIITGLTSGQQVLKTALAGLAEINLTRQVLIFTLSE